MAKEEATPKPMPTTGWPGRTRPIPWFDYRPAPVMGEMKVTNGRPPAQDKPSKGGK